MRCGMLCSRREWTFAEICRRSRCRGQSETGSNSSNATNWTSILDLVSGADEPYGTLGLRGHLDNNVPDGKRGLIVKDNVERKVL
jgi:hypothetical protein